MTKGQIEALVSNWLEAAFDEAEDGRAMGGYISEAVREDAYYGLSALFDGASEDLTSGDYRRFSKEADELLQAAHLPALDHASPEFTRLCRRLLRAKIEYARVEADRWEGEYQENHKTAAEPIPSKETQEPSLPFSIVLEKYLTANPRPARTADPMKAEFMRFMEAVGGDKPIVTVTKADGVQYKESLQLVRKCHPTTCMKYISNADAFFRWAEVHGHIPEGTNPMKGLGISKRQSKKAALKRRPFSTEELLTVFGSTGSALILRTPDLRPMWARRGVMGARRKFSAEYKREAVTVRQIAVELGIGANVLGRLRRELRREPEQVFVGNGRSRDGELSPLRRPVESAQFTSAEYQHFLAAHHITCSMSAVGSCADNAAAEGFVGVLKRERVNRRQYRTRAEARADIFDDIERWHNPRQRRRLPVQQEGEKLLTQPSVKTG
ncbi:MAG: hypothetical protein IPP12_04495 [Nitrospira sp.]|nr:hypothetical protein [Nitrospira sp.]